MAVDMFTDGVVTRSKAQSVIARAAYNARECLTDDRIGEEKDFRHKYGCEWSGIFAPKDAPEWVKDRETLWNAVEEREDHQNVRQGHNTCLPVQLKSNICSGPLRAGRGGFFP